MFKRLLGRSRCRRCMGVAWEALVARAQASVQGTAVAAPSAASDHKPAPLAAYGAVLAPHVSACAISHGDS